MNVSIESNTLLPDLNQFLFRENVISSLKEIISGGFKISISGKALSEKQLKLLLQEGISFSELKEINFSVLIEDSELVVRDGENNEIIRSSDWNTISSALLSPDRSAIVKRETKETEIKIDLNLDGTGKSNIDTGLKFFDHMLEQIARHGLVDLDIYCKGDLEIDEHHTIEDVAIALGDAITQALGNKKGIERYGFVLPMDEAQATVSIDLSGRPYLVFDVPVKREYVGDFPTEMLEHFFYSLAMNLKATLHVSCTGDNDHHKIEACFKGFARALKTAIEQNGRIKNQIPSSKGSL
ncbi:MAG TPA: imidazoleglycerol-phosphate dehydratase HisB [Balneola sp.]|jgi:imidazoleglycerol-phosphate dehydratase/histidinol-phosphatase|nr:imidazoleglycerol-phosphate dehydratase [Balneola sp.]MAO76562.1 imidazoleglycerol-phosphate dehydratase [Balneola sp.]MBF65932.1 imidazoleglycerol-phosphate dehydratase [Balneola sp.]HAH50088.1 imidazoleglycerol-phosphate dehydratase HisB [Balneola sp.]HAW78509.1 imidazoleglycerol-phosphate dehydratase HisB [Balneola sp.]|tara:strand:- start:17278 stop:18165 length:888 start_codon:yes stop_codon:yes gene_type:complete